MKRENKKIQNDPPSKFFSFVSLNTQKLKKYLIKNYEIILKSEI